MSPIPFEISDNWDDHPELRRLIAWETANVDDPLILFVATDGSHHWSIRINDFPDEPMSTLLIDGSEVIHFDDWPHFWGYRPALPTRDS